MVKHLHFNPTNFDQLILSGLLIQIYKNDIQCHPNEQTDELKFIQGPNVVENSIQGILRFANADKNKKYFGLNSQQQAIIDMVNGVCKDIDTKLNTATSPQELTQKISYLNEFWQNPSNAWLKIRFYCCHMRILTLSFRVQQIFPQTLIKYPVFVELRRLFISDKWLSKPALIAMFANPSNKYQEFDLFPQAEGECSLRSSFGMPTQNGEGDAEIHRVEQNFVEIQALEINDEIENYERKSYHHQHENQLSHQPQTQQKQSVIVKQIIESETTHITIQQSQVETKVHIEKHRDEQPQSHTYQSNQESHIVSADYHGESEKIEPQNVAISSIVHQNSAIVAELVSDIKQSEESNRVDQTEHKHSQSHNVNIENQNNDKTDQMKKSLKESFSQHFTKPLEYSTRSLAQKAEQQAEKQHKTHQQPHHQVKHQQVAHQNHHQAKQQTKVQQKQPQHSPIQLKKEVVIDEAQSQKYVSQQHVQLTQQKTDDAHKAQLEQKTNTVPPQSQQKQHNPQQLQQNKPPQSQSLASQKGPKSEMHKGSIKPKEQPVQRQKDTCKCEIY